MDADPCRPVSLTSAGYHDKSVSIGVEDPQKRQTGGPALRFSAKYRDAFLRPRVLCQHEVSQPQLTSPQVWISKPEHLRRSSILWMICVLVPCEVVDLAAGVAKLRPSLLNSELCVCDVCGYANVDG